MAAPVPDCVTVTVPVDAPPAENVGEFADSVAPWAVNSTLKPKGAPLSILALTVAGPDAVRSVLSVRCKFRTKTKGAPGLCFKLILSMPEVPVNRLSGISERLLCLKFKSSSAERLLRTFESSDVNSLDCKFSLSKDVNALKMPAGKVVISLLARDKSLRAVRPEKMPAGKVAISLA